VSSRLRALAWPTAAALLTGLLALAPFLRNPSFYLISDSSSQFVPTWFHLGQLFRAGHWPIWLDPTAWAGGNYAGEALFGIYNPLYIPVWLVMSGAQHLQFAMLGVKAVVLVLLSLGTYLLAREYSAARWASAVVAVALPLSNFTLYWDAALWPAGLVGFACVPWAWWAIRRAARGQLNAVWAFLAGALAITQGDPYGALGLAIAGFALAVEFLLARDRRRFVRLLLILACVVAVAPLVYLPLVAQSPLSYRARIPVLFTDGNMTPHPGDLLEMSSPTFVPDMLAFGKAVKLPAAYFCWFVVPLLPWFRFGALRRAGRSLAGAWAYAGCYLLLVLGPSQLWLFRWPIRDVEYLYLGLSLPLAVLLSEGLHRDHWRLRLLITAAVLGLLGWTTMAGFPAWKKVSVGGPALLVLLTVGLLLWHRFGPRPRFLLALPLLGGCAAVLALQLLVFPVNDSVESWRFPLDVSALRHRAAGLPGVTVQFAGRKAEGEYGRLKHPWRHYLGGSMYQVAGVEAVNSYYGIGYRLFSRQLCLQYQGMSRNCNIARLWASPAVGQPPLVDLMKVRTIIAEPRRVHWRHAHAGWSMTRTPEVVTIRRLGPLPWPGSRLSWASPHLQVTGARSTGLTGEQLTVAGNPSGGTLVFGMLGWPGYTATAGARQLEVSPDRFGLLTVAVPPGVTGRVLVTYRPPHLAAGLAATGLGCAGALALGAVDLVRRRRQLRRR
jgi:hypothetical protein